MDPRVSSQDLSVTSVPTLLLGLDVGGTKSALLGRCGAEEVRRTGPGSNLQRDGLETSALRLATLAREALEAFPGVAQVHLCAGVAGAGRGEDQEALTRALGGQLEDLGREVRIEVVPDVELALDAAFPYPGTGMVVIVGTGSILMARAEGGAVLRAGGWGPSIGDPGSGTALGRDALAAVADDFDGGEPTILRHRLADEHSVLEPGDLIRLAHAPGFRPATLAPLLIDTAAVPDWAATRIIQRQANAVAIRAAWLASRAGEAGEIAHRVALLGGLTAAAHYREVLAEALLRHLPEWRIVRPVTTPEEAAVARASRIPD
jgi:glucosamine kinase